MKILTINSGSSSLKFKLFAIPSEQLLFTGQFKHYEENKYSLELRFAAEESRVQEISRETWLNRTESILEILLSNSSINDIEELYHVVHRIVHGGDKYLSSIELTDAVIQDLEQNYNQLAPLHNPNQIEIVKELKAIYPSLKNIGVFDTSFHSTVPQKAYMYGLPYEYYVKHRVRRYGFHGISHKYISNEVARIYNRDNINIVSCHLGSGSSISAVQNGKSVENTMEFSPMVNLVMSTRVGQIDYNALVYLKERENLTDTELLDTLNKKSGLLGISGYTQDMKILLEDENTNDKAKLAIDIYVYNILKSIGSYFTILGHVDCLVFTGGIGEGAEIIRNKICCQLELFNVRIDDNKNHSSSLLKDNIKISAEDSKVDVWVIRSNEELQMVKDSLSNSL